MPVAEFPGASAGATTACSVFARRGLWHAGRFPAIRRRGAPAGHRRDPGCGLQPLRAGRQLPALVRGKLSRSRHHKTDWGDAINFDEPDAAPVREFFIANAGYWIDEYHLDGLRLDAVQAIIDDSPDHILAAITRQAQAAGDRQVIVTAENELQQSRMLRRRSRRLRLDGGWNDDFHHACRVAMTGLNDAYYADYHGTPQEIISAIKWGYLYQGQWNNRQKKFRGSRRWGIPAHSFIVFLQNHDQVANSLNGRRMQNYTSPGRYCAMTLALARAGDSVACSWGRSSAVTSRSCTLPIMKRGWPS